MRALLLKKEKGEEEKGFAGPMSNCFLRAWLTLQKIWLAPT